MPRAICQKASKALLKNGGVASKEEGTCDKRKPVVQWPQQVHQINAMGMHSWPNQAFHGWEIENCRDVSYMSPNRGHREGRL
eukprot:1162014-Pelagomonas_calceolata.AAC.4